MGEEREGDGGGGGRKRESLVETQGWGREGNTQSACDSGRTGHCSQKLLCVCKHVFMHS